jgi:hypothetical protein
VRPSGGQCVHDAQAHARQSLLDSGDLTETNGELIVVDPVFSEWLRQRFPI